MDATSWVDELAAALGVAPPSEQDKEALLALASVAANASERMAAPISCWVVARSGVAPEDALAVARQLATAGTA